MMEKIDVLSSTYSQSFHTGYFLSRKREEEKEAKRGIYRGTQRERERTLYLRAFFPGGLSDEEKNMMMKKKAGEVKVRERGLK
jgi:hypothetical protein